MADPLTTIPGVASGIDWSAVVDQVIAAQKKPATRLQANIDANGRRKDALEQLRQKLAAVQGAADGLRKGKALDAFAVSSSGVDAAGRSILAATVGTGAVAGTYDITVTALAAAQKTVATTGWDGTQVLSADATLVLGGTDIALKAGDSLATVRDKINAQTTKTGVQASILSVDAGGADQRLVLTGQKTGAANAFSVADGAGGALLAALGIGGANAVDATDAAFTLDGGATTITRPTNLVADAIPGVSLTLTAKGSSALTVDRQPKAGVEAVQAFVDAYNTAQAYLKTQAVAGAPLQNDAFVRSMRGSLSSMVLTPAARVDDSGIPTAVADDMTALNAIGVTVQKDGTLAFDQAKFNGAYPARMNDVRALLADRMSTFFSYADGVTGTYTGQVDRREAAMDAQNVTMAHRIDEINSRLDKQRSALLAKYAKFEGALARMKSVGDAMTAQFSALTKSDSN